MHLEKLITFYAYVDLKSLHERIEALHTMPHLDLDASIIYYMISMRFFVFGGSVPHWDAISRRVCTDSLLDMGFDFNSKIHDLLMSKRSRRIELAVSLSLQLLFL